MELLHCQTYIDLGDYSTAMILVTKTLASLEENNNGNFGKLKLLSQIKVCQIKSNLES